MFRRIAALFLLLAGAAFGASPHLGGIDPAGIQRGADSDVTITGQHLEDARGLLIYAPGIQVLSMQPLNDGKVRARLRVAPDSPLGEHDVRVWTATGISELLPFYVGPFPNVFCSGSNHIAAHAQPVPVNCTVNGVIHDEEIDYFSIQAKAGDRITAEVEGMRLGRDMFDPWASIMDAKGHQLAANDDNALLLQDPLVSIVAPADGAYLVSVRESTWGGSFQSHYRLHIGGYPQPMAVYPSGGPAGETLPVTFLGDVKGPISAAIQLPRTPGLPFAAAAMDGGLVSPAPLPMRVSSFPNVLAKAPDQDVAHATPGGRVPVAFNGIIQHPNESDFFRFHATHGTSLDVTVYARQLRSPLDSVLQIWDMKGHQIAFNDDSIGPDSYLRFDVPADGDYCLSVRDQLHRGGPTYVYRVEVAPVAPNASFTLPEIVRDSQERQSIVVPRGNRFATLLRMKREGVDDGFRLNFPALLPGITVESGSRAGEVLPIVFQAAPDAVVSATLTDVLAQPADPAKRIESGYAQTVEIVYGPPNNYAYLTSNISKLAICVADEAPFQIDLVPPQVPVLEDGQSTLKVTAIRKPGFTGPINVSMLYNPPGVSSQPVVTIPENQTSADIPINASGDAKAKSWQIAAIGSVDAGKGTVWTSSLLVPLTVSKPFVTGQIDRANTIQGEPVAIICHLNQTIPFDGKAMLRLMGLPSKAFAPDIEVSGTDAEAVFNVTTDPTSPVGQHRDLFCQVTVEKSGVKMVANTAFGGVLRIDPAAKKEVASK